MGSRETMVREEGCQQGDRDERVVSDSLHVRLIARQRITDKEVIYVQRVGMFTGVIG